MCRGQLGGKSIYLKISTKLASRICDLLKQNSIVFLFNQVYNANHKFPLVGWASDSIRKQLIILHNSCQWTTTKLSGREKVYQFLCALKSASVS